jgi:predicted AAA+ superfamily ATPase
MSTPIQWQQTFAAIWRGHGQYLRAVRRTDPITPEALVGIDIQKRKLVDNTERFLAGQPSNHALLWGVRGSGKSSLVKAVFNAYRDRGLRLVEVDKYDLLHLPEIIDHLGDSDYHFILYCDDLSFDEGERQYKGLKSALEGSIELPPDNVRVYATSNRRHLMPEYHAENLEARHIQGEIHQGEAVEEKVSLSERFGLWLSFQPFDEPTYFEMIDRLFEDYAGERAELHRLARRFALERGARNGRIARQFYNSFYGSLPG